MPFTILILDDEAEMCESLTRILEAKGYAARSTQDPGRAIEMLGKESVDLLLTDLRMAGLSGISVLRELQRRKIAVPAIMFSGYASVESVVEAMKYGARNFYEKPLKIPKLLAEIGRYAEARERALSERRFAGARAAIITQDPRMRSCIEMVERAAATDVPVVVTGESGTGKELFARAVHDLSPRRIGPFVKLNCASIPEALLESELFGHERGAFTDARESRAGKFEAAEGGTIFLDEIGEMSQRMQAKLLRAVQEREFERVGSNQTRRVDVRFVAATNRDLKDLISRGEFREDLYYRLSVVHVEVPPLRERKDDIPPLSNHFLSTLNERYTKSIEGFSPGVRAVFQRHDWPGNVRELKNCVERAVIFCDGPEIGSECLPSQYGERAGESASDGLQGVYESVAREVILEALDKSEGSRQKAAEILKINRRTLYNKMKRLNIE